MTKLQKDHLALAEKGKADPQDVANLEDPQPIRRRPEQVRSVDGLWISIE